MDLSTLTRAQLLKLKASDFVRWIGTRATADEGEPPVEKFRRRWPNSPHHGAIERHDRAIMKGAVPAATPTDPTWAEALAQFELATAFAEYVQPLTLLGRIQNLRRVPFNTPVARSTQPITGYWAGTGRPKPISAGAFDSATLRPAIASGLAVFTRELLRFAAPGSEAFVRDEMAAGLTTFLDEQFVDPTNAGVTDVYPASITSGVTAAGTSAGDVLEDVRTLTTAYLADGGSLSSAVLLISSANAVALAARSGVIGSPQLSGLTVSGGVVAGLPCVASDSVGPQLILLDARGVVLADQLGLIVQAARQTNLEMSDTPTGNAATGTATSMVSLFQTNSVALRVERFINWERLGAIAVVEGVNYLTEGSPS
jgi:hypothetical protein